MYLDPGFAGMFLQVIIAIVAAGGILIFSLRRNIKNLFSKNKSDIEAKSIGSEIADSTDMNDNDVIDVIAAESSDDAESNNSDDDS